MRRLLVLLVASVFAVMVSTASAHSEHHHKHHHKSHHHKGHHKKHHKKHRVKVMCATLAHAAGSPHNRDGTCVPAQPIPAPPNGADLSTNNTVTPPPFFAAIDPATGQPYQFSDRTPGGRALNPQYFGLAGTDCGFATDGSVDTGGPNSVALGIVIDPDMRPAPTHFFRYFGGLDINCATPAHLISGTVTLQACNEGTACTDNSRNWYEIPGAAKSGVLANTTGSHSDLLVTNGACSGVAGQGGATDVRAAAHIEITDGVTLAYNLTGRIFSMEIPGGCTSVNQP